jgi:hypothetical protein
MRLQGDQSDTGFGLLFTWMGKPLPPPSAGEVATGTPVAAAGNADDAVPALPPVIAGSMGEVMEQLKDYLAQLHAQPHVLHSKHNVRCSFSGRGLHSRMPVRILN